MPILSSRRRRLPLHLLSAAAVTVPLIAQQPSAGGAAIIQSVRLERAPVFDSIEARFWLYRILNGLHARTRPWVIRRELLFAAGEPMDTARINESERNLRALGIFQDVRIDSVHTDSGIVIRVRTIDAWTTAPNVNISTSGTQSVINLSLQEFNLLGTRTVALLGYQNDPDRSSFLVGLDLPRVIRHRIGIGGSYVQRSDGRASAASIRYPFVSLSSRAGGSIGAQSFDGRVLRYAGGTGRPVDSLRRRFDIVRADAAVALAAGPRGFVRVGMLGQLRREDFAPESDHSLLGHTVTAATGPFLSMRAPRFIRRRNVASMGRVEDYDLGLSVQAGVLAAPSAWGYEKSGVGGVVGVSAGHRLPNGFARYSGSVGRLLTSAGSDSGATEGAATFVLQPTEEQLLIAHVGGGVLRNPVPGTEYDLGLGNALRGFPAHAFTGDRRYQVHGEYRVIVWPRLLGLVGVGAAAFADHAGAWYGGSPRRSGTNAGFGLRLASIREAGSVWRLDLSRRYANDVHAAGWVVSLGQGFVWR